MSVGNGIQMQHAHTAVIGLNSRHLVLISY